MKKETIDMEDLIMKQRSEFHLHGERLVKEAELSVKKAEKMMLHDNSFFNVLSSIFLFSDEYPFKTAVEYFELAAKNFDKAKSWDQVGATYVKLSESYLKIRDGPRSLHYPIFAGNYYIKAACAYCKATNLEEAVSCVYEAVQILMRYDFFRIKGAYSEDIADFFRNGGVYSETYHIFQIAKDYSEIAKQYKQEENLAQSILCYEITVRVYEKQGEFSIWSKIDSETREKISNIVEQVIKIKEQKEGDNTYDYSFKDKTLKQKKEEEDKSKSIIGLTSKKKKIEIGLWILVFTFLIWCNYWLWYVA